MVIKYYEIKMIIEKELAVITYADYLIIIVE